MPFPGVPETLPVPGVPETLFQLPCWRIRAQLTRRLVPAQLPLRLLGLQRDSSYAAGRQRGFAFASLPAALGLPQFLNP